MKIRNLHAWLDNKETGHFHGCKQLAELIKMGERLIVVVYEKEMKMKVFKVRGFLEFVL